MKMIEFSRKLLLQTAFVKLSDGCLNRSVALKQARSFTTSHLAVKNLLCVTSYDHCSCRTKQSSRTSIFQSHLAVNSASYHRSIFPPSLTTLLIKSPSAVSQTPFPTSVYSLSTHGHFRSFWKRSKSKLDEGTKVDDTAKPTESTTSIEELSEEKMTLYQRFKQMYKNYWYVLLPVHIVTSIGWGGMFYYIASSGFDIPAFLETVGASQKIIDMMRHSQTGYVAVAYTMYKIATPIRYSVTLGGTTYAIKYLVKHGLIKPVDPNKIKQMYTETKDQLIEKRAQLIEKKDSLRENIMEKRTQVLSHMADCNKKLNPKSNKPNKNE